MIEPGVAEHRLVSSPALTERDVVAAEEAEHGTTSFGEAELPRNFQVAEAREGVEIRGVAARVDQDPYPRDDPGLAAAFVKHPIGHGTPAGARSDIAERIGRNPIDGRIRGERGKPRASEYESGRQRGGPKAGAERSNEVETSHRRALSQKRNRGGSREDPPRVVRILQNRL